MGVRRRMGVRSEDESEKEDGSGIDGGSESEDWNGDMEY